MFTHTQKLVSIWKQSTEKKGISDSRDSDPVWGPWPLPVPGDSTSTLHLRGLMGDSQAGGVFAYVWSAVQRNPRCDSLWGSCLSY